jgi:hypothetical protein
MEQSRSKQEDGRFATTRACDQELHRREGSLGQAGADSLVLSAAHGGVVWRMLLKMPASVIGKKISKRSHANTMLDMST